MFAPFSTPMNAVRRADGLLSARQTLALVSLIEQRAGRYEGDQALRDFVAVEHASRSRTANTIALLLEVGAIEQDGAGLRLAATRSIEDWRSHLGDLVASMVAQRIEAEGGRCLQARGGDGLWLDSMLAPGAHEGLPLWIAEFDVACRVGLRERFWKVSEQHQPRLLAAAKVGNRRPVRRAVTPAQLEARLATQAENGLAAELWVLEYERRRLGGHPLVDQVRRVSAENVSAGYDIASFSTPAVLHHDIHIEVKSFHGQKRFFWTRNEIETAEALAEAYVLYLVDRAQLDRADYVPEIIRGPYTALFLSDESGWSISPTTFECVADA